jgi:hypothetical protein
MKFGQLNSIDEEHDADSPQRQGVTGKCLGYIHDRVAGIADFFEHPFGGNDK